MSEPPRQFAFGDVAGAVEGHVLKKVRHASVGLGLLVTADIEAKAHRHPADRAVVGHQRVSETIRKPALPDRRVGRNDSSAASAMLRLDRMACCTGENTPQHEGDEDPNQDAPPHIHCNLT